MTALTFVRSAPPFEAPIAWDEHGVARVGSTRVHLEWVVWPYKDGLAPDRIARDLPTLDLADIHAVIAYYLRNTEEVEAYLRATLAEEARARDQREAAPEPEPTRATLLARRNAALEKASTEN